MIRLYMEQRITVLLIEACLIGLQQHELGNVTFKTSTYKITKKGTKLDLVFCAGCIILHNQQHPGFVRKTYLISPFFFLFPTETNKKNHFVEKKFTHCSTFA